MAELVDALDSKSGYRKVVQVRFLFWALLKNTHNFLFCVFFCFIGSLVKIIFNLHLYFTAMALFQANRLKVNGKIRLFTIIGLYLCSLPSLKAQGVDNFVSILVKQKDFIFTAQTYTSSSFGSKRLTDYYTVKITKDSIIGNLPYYGQSYTAQINLTDGDIIFTSLKYDYSFVEKKNGKFLVTILPKDERTIVQKLFMTIYSDGKTQLDVLCRSREPITLNGYISN